MDSEKVYSVEEVVKILHTARLEIIHREKNVNFKYKVGATTEQIKSCIREIEVRHFYEGPLDDEDTTKKGKLYVFHKLFLETYWVYVKVKIRLDDSNNEFVAVISFHEQEE